MTKKPTKKKTPTPEYDSTRQQNVLLEKIYSEIKTISEGHTLLSDKVDEMDKVLRKFESTSFKTEMNVQGIKSEVGTIDIKTDRIERELETVKTATMENSRGIKELQKGQEEIKQKVDTITADHEHRIQKLEAIK